MLAVISITLIALALIVGLLKPHQAAKRLGALVLGAAFTPFLWAIGKEYWASIPQWERAAAILLGFPVLFLVIVRMVFGKRVYEGLLVNILYDLYRGTARLIGSVVLAVPYAVRNLRNAVASGIGLLRNRNRNE